MGFVPVFLCTCLFRTYIIYNATHIEMHLALTCPTSTILLSAGIICTVAHDFIHAGPSL